MGFMENALRLPMTTLSAAYQDTVVAALSAAGITK
jgi:hypothetical protein